MTPYSGYEAIGVEVNGEYRQLNTNILQIENEYYSTVRPKQIPKGLESPSVALSQRGVEYIELRSLDVNAYEPLGISACQCYFIEALMQYCLFAQSPYVSEKERTEIDGNELTTAHQGRLPGLNLLRNDRKISLRDWGMEICNDMQGICEILDQDNPTKPYQEALKEQREALMEPSRTPSARMLDEMRENKESFFAYALRKSLQHRDYFHAHKLPKNLLKQYQEIADKSIQQQRAIEASERQDFDTFLKEYYKQNL